MTSSIQQAFDDEGLTPHSWSNGPGYTYAWHAHDYHKVLFCVRGSIVFHTRDGDRELHPGDRLDLPPGAEHAATVGPNGVTCLEAARTGDPDDVLWPDAQP